MSALWMQVRLGACAVLQDGQASFDGLQLPPGYGIHEQDLWHSLCVEHPHVDTPCRIDFRVTDNAGIAEAGAVLRSKMADRHKADLAKVLCQP